MKKHIILVLLQHQLFFVGLMVNIIGVIKQDIQGIFESFPIITVVGPPGTGKTAWAKAIIAYYDFFTFSMHKKYIEKAISESKANIVLIDDLADFKSQGERERGHKIIDALVRRSYSGDYPLVVITSETKALQKQADSCIQRMLLINSENILSGENCQILSELQKNRTVLVEIIQDFHTWYSINMKDHYFYDDLEMYRQQYKNVGTPREIDLVFPFFLSAKLFSSFLKQSYNMFIDDKFLENSMLSLISKTSKQGENNFEVEKLFEDILCNSDIIVQKARLRNFCEKKITNQCEGENCNYCENERIVECIDPKDLVINYENLSSGILLPDIHELYNCPKSLPHEAVLILDAESLLHFVNEEISKKRILQNLFIPDWTITQLVKQLYSYNRIYYVANGIKECRYQFRNVGYMQSKDIESKVIFLRLKENEFLSLEEKARPSSYFELSQQATLRNFELMQNYVGRLHHLPYEVGKKISE